MDLGAQLHAELVLRRQTASCAESVTGGAVAQVLSAAPGASETFLGGIVSYATEVKKGVLGVPDSVVDEHGVVSARCAQEMAEGVRRLMDTDWGVSTTGVAGPDTQEGKPVGLVFVAVAGPDGTDVSELHLDGDRAQIRAAAVDEAVRKLLAAVKAGESAR